MKEKQPGSLSNTTVRSMVWSGNSSRVRTVVKETVSLSGQRWSVGTCGRSSGRVLRHFGYRVGPWVPSSPIHLDTSEILILFLSLTGELLRLFIKGGMFMLLEKSAYLTYLEMITWRLVGREREREGERQCEMDGSWGNMGSRSRTRWLKAEGYM